MVAPRTCIVAVVVFVLCSACAITRPVSISEGRMADLSGLVEHATYEATELMATQFLGRVDDVGKVDVLAWKSGQARLPGCEVITSVVVSVAADGRAGSPDVRCVMRYERVGTSEWTKATNWGTVPNVTRASCREGPMSFADILAFLATQGTDGYYDDRKCFHALGDVVGYGSDSMAWIRVAGEAPNAGDIQRYLLPRLEGL